MHVRPSVRIDSCLPPCIQLECMTSSVANRVALTAACSTMSEEIIRERIRQQLVKQAQPSSVPLGQQRKEWEQSAARIPLPENVSAHGLTTNGVSGLLLVPDEPRKAGLILHVHGGGFVVGSPITHRDLGARLALAARADVLLVDYRLAPEHPFPAARDDVLAAYRWALDRGHDANRIVVASDSAGAHVALSMLLEARAAQLAMPHAIVFISPWVDLAQVGESMQTRVDADPLVSAADLADCSRKYLGDKKPHDPSVALLESDLRGLPRMLVHVGEDEILLSDSERLAQRARAAGVNVTLKIWPKLWHVFHAWAPHLSEANRAISEIGEFANALPEQEQVSISPSVPAPTTTLHSSPGLSPKRPRS